jgi:hypothetical protein
VKKRTQEWLTTISGKFWEDVLNYAKKNSIAFEGLLDVIMRIDDRRARSGRYPKDAVKYSQIIVKKLFRFRGSTRDLCDSLALKIKTGNTREVVNLIRSRIAIPGSRANIIPCNTNVYTSVTQLKVYFIALLAPEKSYSGFRVNLVLYVKLVAYLLLGYTDITNLAVDIWGDACEIGGKEVTRFVFRILSPLPQDLSPQSANAAFCFAAFYGKDTRFDIEENVGWALVGCQESGWLYQHTLTLDQLGVRITYSGDTPFLTRLVKGVASDDVHVSRTPLFVDPKSNFRATTVHAVTGRRTDTEAPFCQDIPPQSLVFMRHVAQICPDITHMMIRLVEFDLRKMAQLLLKVQHPYVELPLRALEINLTERQIKEPSFEFNVEKKGNDLFKNNTTVFRNAAIISGTFCFAYFQTHFVNDMKSIAHYTIVFENVCDIIMNV